MEKEDGPEVRGTEGTGGVVELKKRKRGSVMRGNEEKKVSMSEAHLFSFHLSRRKGVLREDQPASFVTLNVLQPVLLCRRRHLHPSLRGS